MDTTKAEMWHKHTLNLDDRDEELLGETIGAIVCGQVSEGQHVSSRGIFHDIARTGIRKECVKRRTELRMDRIRKAEGGDNA